MQFAVHTGHLLGTLHCALRDTDHYKPLRSVLPGAAYQKIELADATKHCSLLCLRSKATGRRIWFNVKIKSRRASWLG